MDDMVSMGKRALAARYYTDPAVFARQREQLFFKTWQFACHESRVPETGDYYAFSILDQDLFVVRQKDGSLRCFYNVCQHRGHPLVEQEGRARLIVCPYHAWSYGLDGKLKGAHGTKDQEGFDRSKICLTEVRLESLAGFLFANLDPGAVSLAETFPGVEEAVLKFLPDIKDRVFAHEHEAEEHCNWLIAVENYNECYHCRVAHPTFSAGVVDPQSYDIKVFAPGVACLHHAAKAQSGKSAWYDTSGSDYASFFLWPAFSLQLYPSGLVNSYHWRPGGVADTTVHRTWYSKDGVVDDSLQRVIDLDRDTTFAEDLRLVKRIQRGLGSRGYNPGPLVINVAGGIDSEHSIAALHDWVREASDE
jgi:phenylpropionate dioxygenase-like ring-hydroxylating dioxygenase large terminal subunit